LKSGVSARTFFGPGILAYVFISAFFAYGLGDGWSVGEKVYFGFVALIGIVGLYGMVPSTLVADQVGIHYRAPGYRRSYRWSEIEAVGVGHSRAFDGWDAPAARLMMGRQLKVPPTVGLNLKGGVLDPGRTAYQRGFTGYDVNLPDVFAQGPNWVAKELRARLEDARRNASDRGTEGSLSNA
jgi:hypothetical protein